MPSVSRRRFLLSSAALAAVPFVEPSPVAASENPSPAEFAAHQARRRAELWGLLGDLPPRNRPITAERLSTETHPGFTLERLMLDLNGIEAVPAYLLLPDKRQPKAPGLVYIHAHGGTYEVGKEELLHGRPALPAYAPVCAEKGLVTLTIDSWCFSQRKHADDGRQGEQDAFKEMLWRGRVLWGMMMYDEVQATSYLAGRAEVDPERIGAFGISMGSTKAWWLAALDQRVKLCVDLCCLTDYEELIKIGNLKGHGIYYFVPSLLKHFQAHDINELIVPRPRLSLNGRNDRLTPPEGVERIRDHLLPLYRRYGHQQDCRIELFDCGHEETPEMRKLVSQWLDRHLVAQA
jgi:Acetyl xylan esterase (AXE1)